MHEQLHICCDNNNKLSEIQLVGLGKVKYTQTCCDNEIHNLMIVEGQKVHLPFVQAYYRFIIFHIEFLSEYWHADIHKSICSTVKCLTELQLRPQLELPSQQLLSSTTIPSKIQLHMIGLVVTHSDNQQLFLLLGSPFSEYHTAGLMFHSASSFLFPSFQLTVAYGILYFSRKLSAQLLSVIHLIFWFLFECRSHLFFLTGEAGRVGCFCCHSFCQKETILRGYDAFKFSSF